MKATGFTHTSVHAHDLDESVRFYQELFEMEEIPAPDFPFPVRWLRLGEPYSLSCREQWCSRKLISSILHNYPLCLGPTA
jgi:catechol 2,3-dioxygenase-like lactoylglutathione lyase family enzyme